MTGFDPDDPTFELLFEAAQEQKRDLAESGSDKLAMIGAVGAQIQAAEAEIAMLEEAIKQKEQAVRELKTKVLPDLLREVRMNSFTMVDGTEVVLKDEIYPSVPAAVQEKFYEWLRDNGHGDLIKHEIKVTFGMGEDESALALRESLKTHPSPLNFSEKETVLPQSLKAWTREMERRGNALPEDIMTIHRETVAEFKTPKVGGGRKK